MPLASYATSVYPSRGRLYKEPEGGNRSPFQRDRDRIIHSTAFRRLEYKTQVFVNHEGDHFRTRLTHSLEVAQLSRSIARELSVDEDMAEAFALAHDLGHTPFGHAGEDALHEAMLPYGGFDHNAQTLRVLTKLEQRYASFDGLNLTWETLEGIAKHNGPMLRRAGDAANLPRAMQEYNAQHDLRLDSWPGIEAQISALADDIAYHNHDLDDGLRAGLFQIDDLIELPIVGEVFRQVRASYPHVDRSRMVHEATRRIINIMVNDVVEQTRKQIDAAHIETAEHVREAGEATVRFSPEMEVCNKALKSFLMQRMYRHYKVNRMTSKARRIVRQLFVLFLEEPECLPPDWRKGAKGSAEAAVGIADYIAGMTDRFAIQEHRRLFDMDGQ